MPEYTIYKHTPIQDLAIACGSGTLESESGLEWLRDWHRWKP